MYFFLGIVPYDIIMKALAYQADPQSVDPVVKTNPPKEVRKKLIFLSLLDRYLISNWSILFQQYGRHGKYARQMSVQSSLDPYGSNFTLSSSTSSAGLSVQDQNPSRCSSVSRFSN